ncbi:MAG: hypothetical protein C3F15_12845 [Holophagae bacterium]|nr:MAG: hypothetical protein C3F15_12845 [Holophagae bacterium]
MTSMHVRLLQRTVILAAAALAAGPVIAASFSLPEDHRTLTKTTSFAEMELFLRSLDGTGGASVSVEGTSAGGHPLYVVHLTGSGERPWRILLYAQQHGDEVSGKDALLYLVRDIARDPTLLPRDVDLWVVPMVNPDGAEADTRANSAGADLNRDHIILEQPETRALHRLARRLRPAVAVDCHEFGRDSESWLGRGWLKWPDITMDSLDNPLFDPAVRAAALRFLGTAAEAEARAGHPFLRYWVGGVPPDEEQRHSAPDIDGGLNAIGMYGGQSYIIEAAARHAEQGRRDQDLGNRVDAYLALFRAVLAGDGHRAEDLEAIEQARRRPLPAFLPTNYLWVNPDATVTEFPVIEAASGGVLKVPTANLMTAMAVKRTVPTPRGYAVIGPAAAQFRLLLERHGIPFEELATGRSVEAETCTLVRVEDEFDEVYSRYEGRQIVSRGEPALVELAAGSLWIPLEGEAGLRAALVLEPASLYGLYQYPTYRRLVGADGALPVLRVVR